MVLDIQSAALLKEDNKDKRLIFTDGVFDLLHPGHIAFLQSLQELDGELLVCVLADEWAVRKGPGRPVYSQTDRVEMIDSLKSVAYTVLAFDHELKKRVPISSVLRLIRPDIFATCDIAWVSREREFSTLGIELKILPRASVRGISTSEIIRKIKEN